MTITMDGFRVNKTMTLEDMDTDLSTSLGAVAEDTWIRSPLDSGNRMNELDNAINETYIDESIPGEAVGPMADMGVNFAPTADYSLQKRQRKSISKEQADAKTKAAGVKLEIGENGIPDGALDILITRKREEIKRNALITSAPPGFWSGAAKIGTGLAVSIADPINVASAFIPVIGQARYAALLANAGGAAGRAGVRAGIGAAQGLVGAAVVEPLVLGAAYDEQAEYGLYNSYMNLAFGAVLGGGLHSGLGAIGDAISRSSAAAKQSVLQAATGQALDDVPVNVGYVAKTDESFNAAYREQQVNDIKEVAIKDEQSVLLQELEAAKASGALEGSNPRIQKKKAEQLDEDIATLRSGETPKRYQDRINEVSVRRGDEAISSGLIKDFQAEPPARTPQSIYADADSSIEASITIDRQLDETPEVVQGLTDDILLAAEQNGLDTALVRAEISQIDEIADRENAGLREALFCMMGK